MKRIFNCEQMKHFSSIAAVNETRRKLAIRRVSFLCLAVALILSAAARADVLTGTNGERFVGTVIEETTNTIIFQSELGGRMTVSRERIREIERTALAKIPDATNSFLAVSNFPAWQSASNLAWWPPGIGHDKSDWIQLKSGEWLKGELKYIQKKEVEFDSDELDEMTLKLKDVKKVYIARPMVTKFYGQEPIQGMVVISNDLVFVSGNESLKTHRDDLTGITPGGASERTYWSGYLNFSASLQSGNTKQNTMTTMAELARRTPDTKLLIDYLGNYGEVNGVQSVNNDRMNLAHDIRFNRDWFFRAAQLEYYKDPLANISSRWTGGVGLGYYIFDRDTLEWNVAAGPSYQTTRFETVTLGQSDSANTPAFVLQSNFKADITKRLTLIETFSSNVTKKDAGEYTHHSVSTLEFEIKRHLDLDVSYVWDYLMNPQTKSDGTVPFKNDYYLTIGLGVRF